MNTMDINSVLRTLEKMADLELTLAEYYRACSECWPDDGNFWSDLSQAERKHFDYIKQISGLLSSRPAVFEMGRPLNITAIGTAIAGVKNNIEKVRGCALAKKQVLFLSRDLEQSILESRYAEIVKTKDIEFHTLFAEIVSQTEAHKALIKQKIEEIKDTF